MKIRYYGHAGQLTGYGRAAEHLIAALVRADADVEIRTLAPYNTLKWDTHNLPLASLLKRDDDLDPRPDAVIVHTLPMDCPKVMSIAMNGDGGKHPILNQPTWIAYTTWETYSRAPVEVVQPYEVFDQVWHPSDESLASFEQLFDITNGPTINVVPHCYDESKIPFYKERAVPPAATPGRPFRFYTVGAFTARKNPLAIIRAFAHAFTKDYQVELLMACQGMTQQQLTHAICSTGFTPDQLPPIRSDFRPLTDGELWDLHRNADCFVTATRGEAWNLPAFEAVLAGRHVIAPRGMGHDTFLSDTSAFRYFTYPAPAVVDTRAVPGPDGKGTLIQTIGAQGLTAKSLWREPNVLELAEGMRQAYKDRLASIILKYDLPGRFGYEAVGSHAMTYIREGKRT